MRFEKKYYTFWLTFWKELLGGEVVVAKASAKGLNFADHGRPLRLIGVELCLKSLNEVVGCFHEAVAQHNIAGIAHQDVTLVLCKEWIRSGH